MLALDLLPFQRNLRQTHRRFPMNPKAKARIHRNQKGPDLCQLNGGRASSRTVSCGETALKVSRLDPILMQGKALTTVTGSPRSKLMLLSTQSKAVRAHIQQHLVQVVSTHWIHSNPRFSRLTGRGRLGFACDAEHMLLCFHGCSQPCSLCLLARELDLPCPCPWASHKAFFRDAYFRGQEEMWSL